MEEQKGWLTCNLNFEFAAMKKNVVLFVFVKKIKYSLLFGDISRLEDKIKIWKNHELGLKSIKKVFTFKFNTFEFLFKPFE